MADTQPPVKYSKGEFLVDVHDAKMMKKLVKAGWIYDGESKLWFTADVRIAAGMAVFAEGKALKKINKYRSIRKKALAPSLKSHSDFSVPAPEGESYMPFQLAGIEYASTRKRTLIGDPPGLGKTIQAVGFGNLKTAKSILIICPASLKDNWTKEWKKWDLHNRTISQPRKKVRTKTENYKIVKRWTEDEWLDTDVHVINYEMVAKFKETHPPEGFDLVIIDEAHYLKNEDAQRTIAVFGHQGRWANRPNHKKHIPVTDPIKAEWMIALTGTPLESRPKDLWVLCKNFDPDGLGKNKIAFEKRYCNAWAAPWGWDNSGESNLHELQERLRLSFMVRRNKEEVLPDLPPKRRQIIEIPADTATKRLIKAEIDGVRNLLALYETDLDDHEQVLSLVSDKKKFHFLDGSNLDEQAKKLTTDRQYAFQEIAEIRKELAIAKAPIVNEFVSNLMDAEEKVLLFCYHKDVAAHFKESYPDCGFITGMTPTKKRQPEVDRFQDDPKCNPFIGGITAAGVGYTLTASDKPVFAEITWVPSQLEQAEDRAWRIGQVNSVLAYYLLFAGSLETQMMNTCVRKMGIVNQALDATQDFLDLA